MKIFLKCLTLETFDLFIPEVVLAYQKFFAGKENKAPRRNFTSEDFFWSSLS